MIRAFCVGVAASLLVTACLPAPSAPHARPLVAASPPSSLRKSGFRGYRLAASFVDKSVFHDAAPLRTGALVGGLRLRTDASGLSLADSVAEPPLLGGTPLPEALGGGLLFWNNSALYTADTFLGQLKPLLEIGFRPESVSFAPTFALLRDNKGQRVGVDLRTRQRVPLTPRLLVDIASTPDGRALALLEGGACALSSDAGKTYQPVSLPAGERAQSVRVSGQSLLAVLNSGALLRLEKGAAPLLEAQPPARVAHARADALWPLDEPPLERALRYGVPLGDEFAGVAVAGGVATVNLRTGELVQMTRALVPSDLACRALEASGGLFLACSSDHGSIVLSEVFGERPITQAEFPRGVTLSFADGVLLASARCDGQLLPGAVCVRGADGRFHDYDVSAKLASLGAAAPAAAPAALPGSSTKDHAKAAQPGPQVTLSRWIPKQGGGAVAVINGPSPGLLDAQSGAFVALAPEVPRALLEVPRGKEAWLGLDWIALRDGSVRGWLQGTGVAIARDGRLEPSVYEFRSVAAAGAHALAFDRGHHVFQSLDWGRTWVETLAPPGSASGVVPVGGLRCSPVGCHLGPWLRVGWEPEVPAAVSRAQVVPAPPGLPPPALPLLVCKQRAAAVASERPLPQEAGSVQGFGASDGPTPPSAEMHRSSFSWGTVHPIVGSGSPVGLRAGVLARVLPPSEAEPPPKGWKGYAQSKTYSFVSAFDPSARPRKATIAWRALFDAAVLAGSSPPALDPDNDGVYPALPVLGREPGQTDGLVLDDSNPVWAHDGGAGEAFSLGPEVQYTTLISAIASAPHTLLLLLGTGEGALAALQVAAGKAHRLFQFPALDRGLYPANPDALAVGPHGALGVLRSRSGGEPASVAEPLVLLDEHGAPTPLAPWSRLFPADAPECKAAPNDYRAVLQTQAAWLRLVDSGVPAGDSAALSGMFALVRLNPDRICLEAVELADEPVFRGDESYPTRVAARFVGANKGSARLGFAEGFELRQPLDCSLSQSGDPPRAR